MSKRTCDNCDGEGCVYRYADFRGPWREDPGWLEAVSCDDCGGTGEIERDDDDDDEEEEDVEA